MEAVDAWLSNSFLGNVTILNIKEFISCLHVFRSRLLYLFSDAAIKYLSLIVLVIQNASQVLVMRYVRTRPREMFLSTVAIFFAEVVKLIICILFLTVQEKGLIRLTGYCHYYFDVGRQEWHLLVASRGSLIHKSEIRHSFRRGTILLKTFEGKVLLC